MILFIMIFESAAKIQIITYDIDDFWIIFVVRRILE